MGGLHTSEIAWARLTPNVTRANASATESQRMIRLIRYFLGGR